MSTEIYVSESTYSKYKLCLKNYIYPLFGSLDLINMSAENINFRISKFSKEQGKGPLAPKTISDIICILKQIIKFSNQKGISDFNTDLIFFLKEKKSKQKYLINRILKGSKRFYGIQPTALIRGYWLLYTAGLD